jgi:glycosyltransferase involved in cell wall biosynthesis
MISSLKTIAKKKGRSFAQLVMKHYGKLKPLLFWVNEKTRSRIKEFILRLLFKALYSEESNRRCDLSLKKGVNLIGYPRADIGDGEFIRQTAMSFSKVDIEFGIYNYNHEISLSQNNQRLNPLVRLDNPYLVNIFHLKPDQVEASILRLGDSFVTGRLNVGYWVWELSRFPRIWIEPLKYFNELWCPSRFIQSSVSKICKRPSLYMPPAFIVEDSKGFSRDYFNLPEGQFIFLFVFDFKSYSSRKNPLGCIKSFQSAFPGNNKAVGLVIKSMDGNKYPDELKNLIKAAQNDLRIKFIDATFTAKEIAGLMSICDAFVSLHRSEGVGYGLAQSMLLGKPVIATNYSGNTDFTLSDNSCLVDYKLIKVNEGEYPFSKNQFWADPNLEHASSYMQRLVENDSYRKSIAEAGRSYIKANHNPKTVGQNYRRRLIELGF